MNVPHDNEQTTKLLNEWYQTMLSQQYVKATKLKEEIDEKISILKEEENENQQDQNLLLYYSLLDFRYMVLTTGYNTPRDGFAEIEKHGKPVDSYLSYYYHFYKAIHFTMLSDYVEALKQFEEAEKLLIYVPDEIERAEFNYRIACFYYQTYQPLPSIDFVNKALNTFDLNEGYEMNVALCENVLGLTCIQIRQFEKAEEHLNNAIAILKRENNEELLLRVRNNIGWLYESQGLSSLAIRHLSEVVEKNAKHFKAAFLQAKAYYNLKENDKADKLIEQGLAACSEVGNQEYIHRFQILSNLNGGYSLLTLEKRILEGISYFESEGLQRCIQDYAEILAAAFYNTDDHTKASKYYHMSNEARKKFEQKGALV